MGRGALLVMVLLTVVPMLTAREKEVHARWEELAPLVERRDVETVLTNGVYVRGRAEKLLPDALEVRVKKTSDAAVISKGRTRIPRELVTALSVTWKQGPSRVLLTPAFAVGGVVLLAALFMKLDTELGEVVGTKGALGLYAGLGTAGYLVGDRLDGKKMRVVLVRKPPGQVPPNGEGTCGGIEGEFGPVLGVSVAGALLLPWNAEASAVKLSGRIRAADGTALAEAEAFTAEQRQSRTFWEAANRLAPTGADGTVEFRGVPAGRITIVAGRPGGKLIKQEALVERGRTLELVISVP